MMIKIKVPPFDLKTKLKLLILLPHLYILFHLQWDGWGWFALSIFGYYLLMIFQFVGCHRLFSHRSYETSRARELFLMFGSIFIGLGSPMNWAANHRTHHLHADKAGDPHSPHQQRWWEVWTGTGKRVHVNPFIVKDLSKDPVQVFIQQNYFKLFFLGALLIYLLGGELVFRYLLCWPMVITFHATGFINVMAHSFGRRYYDTPDHSYNNPWIFWVTLTGEGWHNYHHAHPTDHRHGRRSGEFDPFAFIIEKFLMKKPARSHEKSAISS